MLKGGVDEDLGEDGFLEGRVFIFGFIINLFFGVRGSYSIFFCFIIIVGGLNIYYLFIFGEIVINM